MRLPSLVAEGSSVAPGVSAVYTVEGGASFGSSSGLIPGRDHHGVGDVPAYGSVL